MTRGDRTRRKLERAGCPVGPRRGGNPRLQRQRQSARPAGLPPRRLDRRLRAAGPLSRSAMRGIGRGDRRRTSHPRGRSSSATDRANSSSPWPGRATTTERSFPRRRTSTTRRPSSGPAARSRRFRWTSKDGFALDWDALEAALRGRRFGHARASRTTRRALPSTAASSSPSPCAARQRRLSSTRPSPISSTAIVSLAGDAPDNVIVVRSLHQVLRLSRPSAWVCRGVRAVAARIRGQLRPGRWARWRKRPASPCWPTRITPGEPSPKSAASARQLIERLRQFPGLHVYPGEANFLLVRLDRADTDRAAVGRRLLREGIAIRTFGAGAASGRPLLPRRRADRGGERAVVRRLPASPRERVRVSVPSRREG